MSDSEVSLELAKLIIKAEGTKIVTEDPREYVLSLFRECARIVHEFSASPAK